MRVKEPTLSIEWSLIAILVNKGRDPKLSYQAWMTRTERRSSLRARAQEEHKALWALGLVRLTEVPAPYGC